MNPVATPEDRTMVVPPGRKVRTGYVAIHRVKLANRSPMSTADVEAARRRQLSLGSSQAWPCPVGEWTGDHFTLHDGRHAYAAALLLGMEWLLVAWVEG